jgi:hypothetical protein
LLFDKQEGALTMDPVANIKEQRKLARVIQNMADSDKPIRSYCAELAQAADRLAELVTALDEWQRRGGFSPYATT